MPTFEPGRHEFGRLTCMLPHAVAPTWPPARAIDRASRPNTAEHPFTFFHIQADSSASQSMVRARFVRIRRSRATPCPPPPRPSLGTIRAAFCRPRRRFRRHRSLCSPSGCSFATSPAASVASVGGGTTSCCGTLRIPHVPNLLPTARLRRLPTGRKPLSPLSAGWATPSRVLGFFSRGAARTNAHGG